MKKSNLPLHRVSAAVLTVLASTLLLAVEANPTGAVHGRQIEVQGNPVIAGNPYALEELTVTKLPTASDADSTDSHSGWRYVWQVGGVDVTPEQDAGSLVAIPPFWVRAGDDGKAVRVCVKAVASSGYPDDTKLSPPACSNELEIENSAPEVSALAIAGIAEGGNTLTGSYSYHDVDDDADASTFQWYRADNAAGTENRVAISGATAKTYPVVVADENKYLVFEVTPRSSSGHPNVGNPVSRTILVQRGMLNGFSRPDLIRRSWSEANTYCNNLVQHGYSDWRLPTSSQLLGLYNLWPNGQLWTVHEFSASIYWSSTLHSSGLHYSVRLNDGGVSTNDIPGNGGDDFPLYVTCVR